MKFVQRLAERRPLLLDGAMGTMLQASGLPAGVSPEEFCMERPDILQGIHKVYLDAGVDIITSCTFGGNPCKLPASLDVFTFNKRMVETARAAAAQAGRPVFVAGNVGPSGHFARPLGDMEPEELIKAFSEQIRGLVAGGADLIFIETQFDLAEARAAVTAARQVCDLPVMVSMTFEQGVSLTGSSPTIFAETMQNMGVAALGTNCSLGPDQMLPVVEELLSVCSCPVVAEPNAGLPELRGSETVFPLGPEAFAQKTAAFAARGARVLGGCCGTTPQHLAALRQALESVTCDERPVVSPSGICLTSRSQLLRLGEGQPFSVIGERINPTGKKAMKEALKRDNIDYMLGQALEQTEAGADILDVNVGLPEIDEADMMVRVLKAVQGEIDKTEAESSEVQDAMTKLKQVDEITLGNTGAVARECDDLDAERRRLAVMVTKTYKHCFGESADVNTLTRLERIENELEKMYRQSATIDPAFIAAKQAEKDKVRREIQRKEKAEQHDREQKRKLDQVIARARMPIKRRTGRPLFERKLPIKISRSQVDQKKKLQEDLIMEQFLYGPIAD